MSRLALLVVLAPSAGWVPTCLWRGESATPECAGGLPRLKEYHDPASGFGKGAMSMLWTEATASDPSAGLGRGISFAWNDGLCDKLLPKFNEDIFFAKLLSCSALRAAITRAFASWSAHHPSINFHDVSAECAKLPNTTNTTTGCEFAEVWVTADHAAVAGSEVAATATTVYRFQGPGTNRGPFVHTSGEVAMRNGVYGADSSILSFNSSLCWYLDSTFCSQFHNLKKHMGDEEVLLVGAADAQKRVPPAPASASPCAPPDPSVTRRSRPASRRQVHHLRVLGARHL